MEYIWKLTWLAHLHERQEMHPLIVAFLQQRLDPSVITLESPKAMQMPQHPGHHTRHASDRLKEQEADHPLRLSKGLDGVDGRRRVLLVNLLLAAHAGAEVHPPATETHKLPGEVITPRGGLTMCGHHGQHLCFSVAMMWPCGWRLSDVLGLLCWEEVPHAVYGRG